MLVVPVLHDLVMRRGGSVVGRGGDRKGLRVLVLIVVQDIGVEGLVIWRNGIEDPSDGKN